MTSTLGLIVAVIPTLLMLLGMWVAWLALEFCHDGGDITTRSPGAAPHNRRRSLTPRQWQPVSPAHLGHAETLRLIWAPPPVPAKVAPSPVLLYGRPPVDVEVLRVAA